jgi:enolase-phosphatase E1
MPIRAILTDIEGTTSSIHFVHQVLFPYAAQALPSFLTAHHNDVVVSSALRQVSQETGIAPDDLPALNACLQQWIKEDRKHGALKAIQGVIWQQGYRNGDYRAHLYPEVAGALSRWAQSHLLYVYSSGSIAAQKLFFRYSEAGDLTPLFSGYFDTTSGPKREPASYQNIARAIGLLPGEILFLSDITEELDAAHLVGMRTTQLLREGVQSQNRHPSVTDFAAIKL